MNSSEIHFQEKLQRSHAYLHFEDGTSFAADCSWKQGDQRLKNGLIGEAAFTTGMTGYQETMTDPSFLGQHIIFSSAHIGNYPADERQVQSDHCHASSLVARHFSPNAYLEKILAEDKIPLFSGLDTRALVKYLVNSKQSKVGVWTDSAKAPAAALFDENNLLCQRLDLVSQTSAQVLKPGDNPLVLVNYGVKNAIVQQILKLGYPLVSLPYNCSAEQVRALSPRLIFLSNGPGDPSLMKEQIAEVKKMFDLQVPIRGICLGHQLLGLAMGIKTIKLPFGQRGVNHPVLDRVSGQILITSQNHGYAVEEQSLIDHLKDNCLGRELFIQHKSLFDSSVEGMASTDHFLKSVQFHPESHPGPDDAHVFFQEIESFLKGEITSPQKIQELAPFHDVKELELKDHPYKKILLVGSGPIKIGQASEFDYSGTQACKALRQIGVDVVLLNSNPATIMTDPEMAFQTYIEPITKDTIKKIIRQENVDAILSTMGGQTALNICIELEEDGFLQEHNVALLGANVDTIKKTEDRALFAQELDTLGYQTGKRYRAQSAQEALQLAGPTVGYPLIIRRDFALGGKGAALIYNDDELKETLESDIKFPITMEKSLIGYKEIELEVMVDQEKNGVIICSIENVDPCGVHTGDSITVAPAQTISDRCYQQLRTMSLTIAKHMGVVAGGANVQFAINPLDEDDIVVIEMNPRVSRSSALASKATGYPIAKISALLSVGYTLKEILNDITKASPVAFEPTLDYVALKIPIFPFNKFPTSSTQLGPQMRSVGEVLSLGSSFNEAFLKALRSVEMGLEIPSLSQLKTTPLTLDQDYIEKRLQGQRELGLLTCLEAVRLGMSVEKIFSLSGVSPWFIEQMTLIAKAESECRAHPELVTQAAPLKKYKTLGLSDKYLAYLSNKPQKEILQARFEHKIFPVFKAVDTCSGEFNAQTPYYYSTYSEHNEAIPLSQTHLSTVIFGSGPNRIGQGIEFDYSCVKACQHLKEKKIKAIMINSNPETVSTDYDSSDRLYLSALYSEDLFDILCHENPHSVIASFSGQTGINLREHIETGFRKEFKSFKFLGPTLDILNLTEDRKLFSQLTKKVELGRTKTIEARGHKELMNAMVEIGLPVIIRPSYVIGGESMYIFRSFEDIHELPDTLKEQLKNTNVVFQVENYLENAIEYDIDLIRDKEGHCVFAVCEHIEFAGVHSGDSGMICPPVILTERLYQKLKKVSCEIAHLLEIVGPINIQFAIKDGEIYCIEANPRGSRTLPFLSKAYNVSLPSLATDAMLGEIIEDWEQRQTDFFCVKQSTFPFDRFLQDNIILGPKMRSTGETMGIDYDKDKAILKSYLGNYPKLDQVGKIMLSLADNTKEIVLPYLKALKSYGYQFVATTGTCQFIKQQGLPCENVAKIDEEGKNIVEALKDEAIVMVFNTPMNQGHSKSDGEVIRNTAILYGIPCFTRPENITAVMSSLMGSQNGEHKEVFPVSLQTIHQPTRGRRPW